MVGVLQNLWQGRFSGALDKLLAQDGADADEYQVTDSDHNRQLDDQHGNSKKDFENAKGYAGGGQYDGDAHRQYENPKKYNAYNS
jgi:hypothetical protein